MHIYIKTTSQISIMREAGKIHAEIMQRLVQKTQSGIVTDELNDFAEKMMRKFKVEASFKGYRGFPKSICVCLNEEVVHGIPSKKRVIKEGDLVKLDLGVYYKGFHVDAGLTVIVGKVSPDAKRLTEVTRESLKKALEVIREGIMINQVGKAVEDYVTNQGFFVVKELTGHGIGRRMHEPPEIPNYYRPGDKNFLEQGMTLAIEPMVNIGTELIVQKNDGWTVETADKNLSAYWEHTVAVTKNGCNILTSM